MSGCGAEVKIQATPLPILIGDGIPLALPLTFVEKGSGDPYPIDVDDVTAQVGDVALGVAQTDTNIITVSASAGTLAGLPRRALSWTLSVAGVPWLAGQLRVTTQPGCSTPAQTVEVQTSPTPVVIELDPAAVLAGQVADLSARLTAIESETLLTGD